MHLLFTLRVLFFHGRWSKVRNVDGLEDRSLEPRDESQIPRSIHVRAHSGAVQNSAVHPKNRGTGTDKFSQGQHGGYSRVAERSENASPGPPQAAL
jgi:hypothetical protein